MGTKIDFDASNREFVVLGPPDANGVIDIDLQVDLYSDAKVDWVDQTTYPDLSKMKFPVDAIGGNPFGSLTLGSNFLIKHGWHFKPYEGNHVMNLIGNIGTESGWTLVQDTVGAYRVHVTNQISAIVELRESGTSGLTSTESQALIDIAADQTQIASDISTISANVILTLTAITGLTQLELAEKITNPSTGKLEIANDTAGRRWVADAWEDPGKTVPYTGGGLEAVGEITEIAY